MGKLKSKSEIPDVKEKNVSDPVDRIILKRQERDRLDAWLTQLNDRYDGLVKFSKSDLANFLIRQQEQKLSEIHIKQLGAELYDEMRWINRAIEKVRQAKRAGIALSLEDLMANRRPLEKLRAALLKRDEHQRSQGANNKHPIENQVDTIANETLES
jgi:hypothetical protein